MKLGKIYIKMLRLLRLISEQEYRARKIKYLPHIDKAAVGLEINRFNSLGTLKRDSSPRLIVSLTSFPERMYDIHYTLYSLLNQSLKPDTVILWLAEEQFPDRERDIPADVLRLRNNGLVIKWCEDLRSYKKLVPALKEFPDDIIITADDDIYYPQQWLELLYTAYLKNPRAVHCHRGHQLRFDDNGKILPYKKWKHRIRSGAPAFINFSTGAGGALYPPHSLYKDVTEKKLFQKLAPHADDIWFWAMAVMNNTPVNVVDKNLRSLIYINPEREMRMTDEFTLAMVNCAEGRNDAQLQAVIEHYPHIKENIFNS